MNVPVPVREGEVAAAASRLAPGGPPGSGPRRAASPERGGVRGRRQRPLLRIRGQLGFGWKLGLATVGIGLIIAVWAIAAANTANSKSLLPTPAATWHALVRLKTDGVLSHDLWASLQRVLIGYGISIAIGVVIGIAIGTFASVEAFFEAQIGFLRYIPASALTPLFLLWLGIGESPKIWLIVVGTVFYNVLMIADVARSVPRELLNASYTLGAGRLTVIRRVILRHSVPGIIDVARINLAAAWLMLVVAEILAAQEGLAYQIIRAQRFRAVDTMFAILIVFGVIGLFSDVFLRWLRNVTSPWARP
ncbi:MAG: transporter permease [Ilumatobacteraceae bacterium]|nr:transporter permease [Ilumatobacteraceae bacterium]